MRRWQPLPESLEPETRDLVEQMRRLKEATGMSLVELAARTAHSKSAWHRYLNGDKFPPRSAVEALGRLEQADRQELLRLWIRAQAVRARCASPPQALPPTPGEAARPTGRQRHRVLVAAVAALSLAAIAWAVNAGSPLHAAHQAPAVPTAAPAPRSTASAAAASRQRLPAAHLIPRPCTDLGRHIPAA
jgi:hypothetical protein